MGCTGLPAIGRSRKIVKNLQFLNIFKKNGAGVRVLRSLASVFVECLIKFVVFVAERHGASLGPPGRQMRDTRAHLGGRQISGPRASAGGRLGSEAIRNMSHGGRFRS